MQRGQSKRRIFWFVLGVVATLTFQSVAETVSSRADSEPEPGKHVEITEETPTVWHIVKKEFPDENPWKIIHQIEKLNDGIDFGKLRDGQKILLPKDGE